MIFSAHKLGHSLVLQVKIPLPYRYRGAGVAVFKEVDGETCVLLGRRKYAPFAKRWTFPGGGQEQNESFLSTSLREFREETGCEIRGRYIKRLGYFRVNKPLFKWQTTLIETEQDFYPVLRSWGIEFSDLKWVGLSEIKKYALHPFVKKAIKAYLDGKCMKKYTPKKTRRSNKNSRLGYKVPARTTHRVEDDYNFELVRVDKDGTRYYKPVYPGLVVKSGK